MDKLEEIQAEYKNLNKNAKVQEIYIYTSGLCEATARIIKFLKNDEEETEWDGTEIESPIDSDIYG